MADLSPFSPLPNDAQLWIHAAAEPLPHETQEALLDHLSTFIEGWTSHQHAVEGAAAVLHDRFLIVAGAPVGGDEISGCGIDDLTHAVEQAASSLDIEWVPSLHVLYRAHDGSVVSTSRRAFQAKAKEGAVSAETPVFDLSLTALGPLRDGQFERAARDSWHAQLLKTPAGT